MTGSGRPLQNRVLPTGEIVAHTARGRLTGNRGILHDATQGLGNRRWAHQHWISCRLDWPGVRRVPMTPGTWTELFFLDEAVALAAGHRPCARCRRAAFSAFAAAWEKALGPATAPQMDRALHAARVTPDRLQRRHLAPAETLPDHAFVLHAGRSLRLWQDQALPFAPEGYGAPEPRPSGIVTVLTPAPILAVMAAGYRPELGP